MNETPTYPGARVRSARKHDSAPRYSGVRVHSARKRDNAFFLAGNVLEALKRAGVSPDEVERFKTQALAGDYDNLLGVCMDWVTLR